MEDLVKFLGWDAVWPWVLQGFDLEKAIITSGGSKGPFLRLTFDNRYSIIDYIGVFHNPYVEEVYRVDYVLVKDNSNLRSGGFETSAMLMEFICSCIDR